MLPQERTHLCGKFQLTSPVKLGLRETHLHIQVEYSWFFNLQMLWGPVCEFSQCWFLSFPFCLETGLIPRDQSQPAASMTFQFKRKIRDLFLLNIFRLQACKIFRPSLLVFSGKSDQYEKFQFKRTLRDLFLIIIFRLQA